MWLLSFDVVIAVVRVSIFEVVVAQVDLSDPHTIRLCIIGPAVGGYSCSMNSTWCRTQLKYLSLPINQVEVHRLLHKMVGCWVANQRRCLHKIAADDPALARPSQICSSVIALGPLGHSR